MLNLFSHLNAARWLGADHVGLAKCGQYSRLVGAMARQLRVAVHCTASLKARALGSSVAVLLLNCRAALPVAVQRRLIVIPGTGEFGTTRFSQERQN
jgi:hypothetical protein